MVIIIHTSVKSTAELPIDMELTSEALSYAPVSVMIDSAIRLGQVVSTVIQRNMVGIHMANAETPAGVRLPAGLRKKHYGYS